MFVDDNFATKDETFCLIVYCICFLCRLLKYVTVVSGCIIQYASIHPDMYMVYFTPTNNC